MGATTRLRSARRPAVCPALACAVDRRARLGSPVSTSRDRGTRPPPSCRGLPRVPPGPRRGPRYLPRRHERLRVTRSMPGARRSAGAPRAGCASPSCWQRRGHARARVTRAHTSAASSRQPSMPPGRRSPRSSRGPAAERSVGTATRARTRGSVSRSGQRPASLAAVQAAAQHGAAARGRSNMRRAGCSASRAAAATAMTPASAKYLPSDQQHPREQAPPRRPPSAGCRRSASGRRSWLSKPSGRITPKTAPQPTSSTWLRA